MSLRVAVTASVVGILMFAMMVFGTWMIRTVDAILIDQVDARLLAIAERPDVPPRETDGSQPSTFGQPGEQEGGDREIARLRFDPSGELISAEPALSASVPEPLPSVDEAAAAPVDVPTTIEAADGAFDYRVLAVRESDGSMVVIGESIGDERAAVAAIAGSGAVGGMVVLVVAALGCWGVIRNRLRPVGTMIAAATSIAEGDFSARGDFSQRADQPGSTTELGELATALDNMVEQLDDAFDQRLASEARVRRFAADASHELRTPIAVISGYAELYQQGGIAPDTDLDRAMERIASETGRMGRLVEDLLMLARLDRRAAPDAHRVDLSAVASDAVADFRAVDPHRPATLTTSGPAFVVGDRQQLSQVITNLLSNVTSHTEPGTRLDVVVQAVISQDDGDEILVAVHDDGGGLTPDEKARVFDRFYRAPRAKSGTNSGTGLGLSIVSEIVRLHTGTIEVDSQPGSGTTFRIRLPAATAGQVQIVSS